jgi:hypothetical protein
MAKTTQTTHAAPGDASQAWAGVFASLLGEQLALLRGLDGLSVRQRALIEGEDADALVALMDERQRIVDRLEALTARLVPMQTRWDEGWRGLGDGLRGEVEENLRALSALAQEIAARDAEDQALVARRKREIAEELASTAGNQRAMHAYAGGSRSGHGAVFQDREA